MNIILWKKYSYHTIDIGTDPIPNYIQGLYSNNKFDTDPVYRGALLHYLYLLADTCIVVAEMTIKNKNLRPPQSYSEAFDILGDNGVLEPEFAYSFAKIAGFRNFFAHDYDTIDTKVICDKILIEIKNIQTYVAQIQKSFDL